jgi:SAM-dependent methyltransferase
MSTVLNVGGNTRDIPLPPIYQGWTQVLLDIDASAKPDIVCDARELTRLPPSAYDAVYCSHNLEHYYHHEVAKVLAGFLHVMADDGFAHIRVPDLNAVMREMVAKNLDIEDVLYVARAGPITVRDVIYGWAAEIERSGEAYFAHKTGFTVKSLVAKLTAAGFKEVYAGNAGREIIAFAFKSSPTEHAAKLLKLPRRRGDTAMG